MEKSETQKIVHPLRPVYDAGSRVLILGTMPSPKSRENGFYYTHPQNRFWRVLAGILGEDTPADNAGREALARRHHIALWDVLASCEIRGAADGSIQNPVVNDLGEILKKAPIRRIFTTGRKATELYARYLQAQTGRISVYLPSTSPANAGVSLEELEKEYRQILPFLEEVRLLDARPEDGREMAHLFYDAVHMVNCRDYTPEQLAAWAPEREDAERFSGILWDSDDALTARAGETLIGFANRKGKTFDCLYVQPGWRGTGVAGELAEALENRARAAGVSAFRVEASITARGFFARRGYALKGEQTVFRRGVALTNYQMEKRL